jgi:hypothetical protein
LATRPNLRTLPEAEIAHRAVIEWESLVSLKIGFLDSDCGTTTLQNFCLQDFEAPKPVSSRLMMR